MEAGAVVVGNEYCEDDERELTVRKTSHFCPGDGFDAYDNLTGDLAFRVDNYGHGSAVSDDVELMDPAGACIITLRRKRRTLHSRWEGFLGERAEGKKPLFSVHRPSIFCGERTDILVDVYGGDDAGKGRPAEYKVEGSFSARSCRVLRVGEEREEVVAVIKRKVADPSAQVVLGRDVFCLSLRPHADAAFAMGIVLALDQISVEEDYADIGLDPAAILATPMEAPEDTK